MSTITRRRFLVAAVPAAAVAIAGQAAATPAAADPIVVQAAEAIRLGETWSDACGSYSLATDAALAAGLPTQAPVAADFLEAKTSDEISAILAERILEEASKPGESGQLAKIIELVEASRKKATRAKAARLRREATAYKTALARWEEADGRFDITEAQEAMHRAKARLELALDAVEAEGITSTAGAFAVVMLAHWLLGDGDDERSAAMLGKVCTWLGAAGVTGAGFPACQHPI